MAIILLSKITKSLDDPPTSAELIGAHVPFSSLKQTGEEQDIQPAQNRFFRDAFLHPNLPINSNNQLGLSEYLTSQLTPKGNCVSAA